AAPCELTVDVRSHGRGGGEATEPASRPGVADGREAARALAALARQLGGCGLVAALAVGALALLHAGLVDVTAAVGERVAHLALDLAEQRPVAVVVVLDDLERPAALDDIATDQVALDPLGDVVTAGLAQHPGGLAQLDVRAAGQLVERVQVAAGPLARLQRLRHLADGVDDRVGHALGRGVVGQRQLVGTGHPTTVPQGRHPRAAIASRSTRIARGPTPCSAASSSSLSRATSSS